MSSAAAHAIVTKATAATLAANTAATSTNTRSSTGGPNGGPLNVTSTGKFDFEKKHGVFRIDLAALGTGSEPSEIRLLGKVIYFKAPAGILPAPKAWLKIDLDDPSLPASAAGIAQFANSDPASALSFLKGLDGDVEVVGTEDVRGETTTHFRATIDTAKAAESADPTMKALLKQTLERGVKEVPTDLWIDAEGRLRRVTQVVDLTKSTGVSTGAAQGGKITTTMEFFDFGTEVEVVAPPDAEIASLAELENQPAAA